MDLDRVRDRERVVVAEEDRVLQVAEIGGGRPDVRRRLGARTHAVEAREVDDAALVQLLGDGLPRRSPRASRPTTSAGRGRRRRGRPGRRRRRATRGIGAGSRVERAGGDAVRRARRRGSSSTSRRSTHSNVVRRHASATSSSSPGRGRLIGERRRQVLGERDLGRARARATRRARRARGRATGCAAGRGTRASAAPAARPCAAMRRPRRRRAASACRRARAPSPRDRRARRPSAVPRPAIPPPTTMIRKRSSGRRAHELRSRVPCAPVTTGLNAIYAYFAAIRARDADALGVL